MIWHTEALSVQRLKPGFTDSDARTFKNIFKKFLNL